MDESLFVDTFKLSKELRENGILTETMLDSAKIGKQIQIAEKKVIAMYCSLENRKSARKRFKSKI